MSLSKPILFVALLMPGIAAACGVGAVKETYARMEQAVRVGNYDEVDRTAKAIVNPALGLGLTGGLVGTKFGPVGTGLGAVLGAAMGAACGREVSNRTAP